LITGQQRYAAREEAEEEEPEFDVLDGELEARARMAAETLETGGEASGAEGGEDGEGANVSLDELAEREASTGADDEAEES
jgi:hypothetical protein